MNNFYLLRKNAVNNELVRIAEITEYRSRRTNEWMEM